MGSRPPYLGLYPMGSRPLCALPVGGLGEKLARRTKPRPCDDCEPYRDSCVCEDDGVPAKGSEGLHDSPTLGDDSVDPPAPPEDAPPGVLGARGGWSRERASALMSPCCWVCAGAEVATGCSCLAPPPGEKPTTRAAARASRAIRSPPELHLRPLLIGMDTGDELCWPCCRSCVMPPTTGAGGGPAAPAVVVTAR
mmetsp:Transcript_5967/g.23596  ORF Transcript_5967/g.23596 Transcript_5967/m.23596 type:complete len:195 (+) Transcript_5967:1790-2374(+)